MRLVPGTVVDTPEGPRLLPPGKAQLFFCFVFTKKNSNNLLPTDIKGDGIDLDYVVQGFDIDQIEARYFQKKKSFFFKENSKIINLIKI